VGFVGYRIRIKGGKMNSLAKYVPETEYAHLEDIENLDVIITKARIEESEQYGKCAIFTLDNEPRREYITFARFVVSALENVINAGELPVSAKFVQRKGKGGRRIWLVEQSVT
jgi:hypothetical protein